MKTPMMTTRWITSLAALLCVLALGADAWAQSPPLISFQGYVTDSEGVPLEGEIEVRAAFYTGATDSTLLFEEELLVQAQSGFFTAELGLTTALDLSMFRDHSQVWIEITIQGDTLEPRMAFGTAPYAAWADFAGDAERLGGYTAQDLMSPSWDNIVGVPERLQNLHERPVAGAGLREQGGAFEVDGSVVQQRIQGACDPGSALRVVLEDGSVVCEPFVDTNTTYQAGQGLVLDGEEFRIDPSAVQRRATGTCGEGSAIREILEDGSVVCELVGTAGGTSWVPGAGLELDEGVIHIPEGAITGTMIQEGTIELANIRPGSLSENALDLQGMRVVSGSDYQNVWSRLLVTSRTPFSRFRIMVTVNGLTGGGSTTPGGSGLLFFDLAQDCQTAYGGDQTMAVQGTPAGGYPLVYLSDEFEVGAVACFIAVKVAADTARPVVVREVQLIPTVW